MPLLSALLCFGVRSYARDVSTVKKVHSLYKHRGSSLFILLIIDDFVVTVIANVDSDLF